MAGFGHKKNPRPIKKTKSDNAQVKLQIAIAAYQSGQLKKAKELCAALAKESPRDSFALGLFATIEKQLGNTTSASELFKASLRLNPDNADFHHNYAGLLIDQDLKKAHEHSSRAVALSPNQPSTWKGLVTSNGKKVTWERLLRVTIGQSSLTPNSPIPT